MLLRHYQRAAIDKARERLRIDGSALIVVATGGGKTVIFSHLAAEELRERGKKRVLFLAHRQELILQAANKLRDCTGVYPCIEMGQQRADRWSYNDAHNPDGVFGQTSPFVVASEQSLMAGPKCRRCMGGSRILRDPIGMQIRCPDCIGGRVRRMQEFDPAEFGLIVMDEAHRSTSPSQMTILSYFAGREYCRLLAPDQQGVLTLGVTATPTNEMGQIFKSVAFEYSLTDAIADGFLVPVEQYQVNVESIDLSGVQTVAGDLRQDQLEEQLVKEESVQALVAGLLEHAGDRPTLVFCQSVKQAERCFEVMERAKPGQSILIHGKMDRTVRARLLAEFHEGEYQYIFSCMALIEGYDEPRISCVAMGRPTKSYRIYAQGLGRGTRPISSPVGDTADERRQWIAMSAKPSLLILDFVGNCGRHKLVSTVDIIGSGVNQKVLDRARRLATEADDAELVNDLLARAADEINAEEIAAAEAERKAAAERAEQVAEEIRRKMRHVTATVRTSKTAVDPFDLMDIVPDQGGVDVGHPITDKQVRILKKLGVEPKDLFGWTSQQAAAFARELDRRKNQGLCSWKMLNLMKRWGASDPERITQNGAKWLMGQVTRKFRMPRHPGARLMQEWDQWIERKPAHR